MARSASKRESIARFAAPVLLDANDLELFARVVQAGSFAAAARRLGQTRAAVSRRVAAMELQIGQPLLARTTRSLGLTEAGRRLASRASAVLEAADAARGALRATQAGLAGRLRITATPSFGRFVLVPLLAAFRRQHPEVQVELLFTDRRIDLLREGVDLAFRITRQPPPDWVARALLPFRVGAYAHPSVADALPGPEGLAELPALLLGAARDERMPLIWTRDGQSCRVEVRGVAFSEDLDSLIGLALAADGVVLAPDYAVRDHVQAGRLRELLPGWQLPIAEGDTVQALSLPFSVAPASARELVKFVAERLAESASTPVLGG